MDVSAQGAIEYLLIIGAAILVVAIVVVSMTSLVGAGEDNVESSQITDSYNPLLEEKADAENKYFIPQGTSKIYDYVGDETTLGNLEQTGENISICTNEGICADDSIVVDGGVVVVTAQGGNGTISKNSLTQTNGPVVNPCISQNFDCFGVCDGSAVVDVCGDCNGDAINLEDCDGYVLESVCGNDVVEFGEVCDGVDLNGFDCSMLGFVLGDLSCASDCLNFDTSECETASQENKVELLNSSNVLINSFDTFGECIGAIQPGQKCLIYPGIYSENFKIVGKNNIIVTFAFNQSGKAIFRGSGASNAFYFYNVNNVLVDGWDGVTQRIVFEPIDAESKNNGLLVRIAEKVTIKGLEISREYDGWLNDASQMHGININGSGVKDIVIQNNYIHHFSGDGININVGARTENKYNDFVVADNTIVNVGDDGIQAGSNITFENNHVEKGDVGSMLGGHPDGIQLSTDKGFAIIRNNFFKGFGQNIFVEWAKEEIYIYNNVMLSTKISGSDRGMTISARDWTIGTNFLVANNIFYNFVTYYGIHGGGSLISAIPPENLIVKNNIFINNKRIGSNPALFDSSNMYWDLPGVQYYDTDGNPVGIPSDRQCGDSVFVNPTCLAPELNNFNLFYGSPAINSGVDLSEYFTTDFSGVSRPQGSGWDIGAFEFVE